MTVTIEHTAAAGTLVEGTSRGDGSAAILKGLGWRWGRSIGCWFVPRSRDAKPNLRLIERTAQALRADGFEVEVSVDETRRATAEVEADHAARAQAHAQALGAKAERLDAQADATYQRARELASHIPLGQPILVGHHSERRARRDRQRISATYDKSFQLAHDAQEAHRAAVTAAAHTGARYSVATVGNRLDTLGAALRRAEREGHTQQAAELAEQVAYWQDVRTQQLADGTAGNYGPHTIKAGDVVQCGHSWYLVERVSAKSVTLRGDISSGRVPYHQLNGHRTATPADHAVAHLRKAGWTILARDWEQDGHRLDLVACDPDRVVVPILLRHSTDRDPLADLTPADLRALKAATDAWVVHHGQPAPPRLRLDAVGVRTHPTKVPEVTHHQAIG